MKKYFKSIANYILIFIISLICLIFLFLLVTLIPRKYIEKNIYESVPTYVNFPGIYKENPSSPGTWIHYYADSILLNILYHMDYKKPIKAIAVAKYYESYRMDSNNDFVFSVMQDKKANQEYIRYWHGSIIPIKLLLLVFNIKEIYLINKILIYLLSIILLFKIFKKDKKLSIFFLVSMICSYYYMIPKCFEYSSTIYIMLISSIIVINMKDIKKLFRLIFINGILTCFFDFLSTELLTLLVPILLFLLLNKKRYSFKVQLKILIISCLLWCFSYALMFISKWIFASIVLKTNVMPYVKNNLFLRINGLQGLNTKRQLYLGSITRNINILYPLSILNNTSKILLILFSCLFLILNLDFKKMFKKKFNIILILIILIPYIRYLVLANHSFRHFFFTFRSQIIVIISILEFIRYNFKSKNISNILGGFNERINNTNAMSKRRKNH